MSEHVIVGAGAVGSATALLLAERGEHVRVISRRGTGPEHPAIERVPADATDAERLTELAAGAAALYNCANPPYHQWLTDWPPLASALLTAAERSGAVLATMSNLYGYGPVDGPITQKTPLAATHPKLRAAGPDVAGRAGGARGRPHPRDRGPRQRLHRGQFAPVLRRSASRCWPARAGIRPRRWMCRTAGRRSPTAPGRLTAVAADERAHGQAWLVPTNPALTVRQLATRFTEVNGAPAAKLMPIPYPVLWSTGLFSPMIKELRTTRYQFTSPFVIDSSATTQAFGLEPTPLDAALRDAAARLRS